MEPIKFEKQIKDKLEKRNLKPSKGSWEKLSQQLDAENKKRKQPLVWWLDAAAAITILLALSVTFFNNKTTDLKFRTIAKEQVEDFSVENEKSYQIEKNNPKLANQDQKMDSKNKIEERIHQKSKIISNRLAKSRPEVQNKQWVNTENKSHTVDLKKEGNTAKTKEQILVKDAMEEALKELNQTHTSVSENEIDSLLKLAGKEILADGMLEKQNTTVDANMLLMSVEDEMGQSFRIQVFEALKSSYNMLKTAVAERGH